MAENFQKILKYCSITAVAAAVIVASIFAYKSCTNIHGNDTRVITCVDTIVTHDTIVQPTTVTVTARHTDTIFVNDLEIDTVRDTLFVLVPITQSLYHYPDTADIYISGYRARIDSISLVYHEETVYLERPQPTASFVADIGARVSLTTGGIAPSIFAQCGVDIKRRWQVNAGLQGCYLNGFGASAYVGVTYHIR